MAAAARRRSARFFETMMGCGTASYAAGVESPPSAQKSGCHTVHMAPRDLAAA